MYAIAIRHSLYALRFALRYRRHSTDVALRSEIWSVAETESYSDILLCDPGLTQLCCSEACTDLPPPYTHGRRCTHVNYLMQYRNRSHWSVQRLEFNYCNADAVEYIHILSDLRIKLKWCAIMGSDFLKM